MLSPISDNSDSNHKHRPKHKDSQSKNLEKSSSRHKTRRSSRDKTPKSSSKNEDNKSLRKSRDYKKRSSSHVEDDQPPPIKRQKEKLNESYKSSRERSRDTHHSSSRRGRSSRERSSTKDKSIKKEVSSSHHRSRKGYSKERKYSNEDSHKIPSSSSSKRSSKDVKKDSHKKSSNDDYSELILLLQRRSKSPISEDELEVVCPALLNIAKMEKDLSPEKDRSDNRENLVIYKDRYHYRSLRKPKLEDNQTPEENPRPIDNSTENALTDDLIKDTSISIEEWEEELLELERDRTSLLRIVSRIDFARGLIDKSTSNSVWTEIKNLFSSKSQNDSDRETDQFKPLPIIEEYLFENTDNLKDNKYLKLYPEVDTCSQGWDLDIEKEKKTEPIPLSSFLQLNFRKSLINCKL